MPLVRIGQALTSLGMVTDAQLQAGLLEQQRDRSVPLGETLVRMGLISRADLKIALAHKMGYPLVNLERFPASAEALRRVSQGAALRLQVMPLMVSGGRLVAALDDPSSHHAAIDDLEFIAQAKVVPVLAQCRNLNQILQQAYGKIGATDATAAIDDPSKPLEFDLGSSELLETLEKEVRTLESEEAPIEQSDNSLVRMVNRMIIEAHAEGVSDVHIESYPGREKIRIRFRRDGRLSTYLELSQRDHRADQDHVRPRHQREAQAAGREDQLRALLRPASDRAAGGDHPDPQRPGRRGDADPGLGQGDRTGGPGPVAAQPAEAARSHGAAVRPRAVRRPDRLRQDDDAAFGAGARQHARAKDLDRRGSIRSRSRSRVCARCR